MKAVHHTFGQHIIRPPTLKKKRDPQKILEIVLVFTTTATAATGRWPLYGERTTSAGAFMAGIHRRFAPEAKTTNFFLIFGEIPI